ncbi:VOC family protein [Enhygromyxa salina]|uniref:Glyoxalase/Bleomycin resistance protein/Dioxygenase superfamily protein n=1 Tax=Enhygromyxa salina TaxID=215803 RepID=A0A2S9Y608_9BACT|nr:VOC family protein [Enhygromyxa salina]PRQ00441.1 Glyoxalase/Bleomycin resistance protein/Dioxygenase superfamily protein [Enhygromyxa salina]
MSTSKPLTRGVHHVGLTVPNIRATRDFFVDTLGFQQVGEQPAYPAVFVSDGSVMLTLWQADAGAAGFDRKRCVGLHHVALAAADHRALDLIHETVVARADVQIEFPPEPLGTSGARHMMCTVPGGVRVEFISTTAGEA